MDPKKLSTTPAILPDQASPVTSGKTEEMVSVTGSSSPRKIPFEFDRRKPGACGTPVILADGQAWLLAQPSYRPRADGLTTPDVDRPLDRVFECSILNEPLSLCDLWEVARNALNANYELSEDELATLLSVSPGQQAESLGAAVVEAILASEIAEKSFTNWVRASLLANGLGQTDVPARDLLNVLTILVATNRTVPLSRFADACRLQDERNRLETLL